MMDQHYNPEMAFRDVGAHEEHFTQPPPLRGKPFGRLRLLTIADAAAAPARHYLLKGLVAPGELSLWWGAPKCGKSFLLLRLAYGLALGIGMWVRKAKPCRVLYVAAEGEGGFAARLLALSKVMGDAGDTFCYLAQPVVVGPPADDLLDVIAAAIDMRATVIVLDTLARTFGDGDESTARDMGGFVSNLDKIRSKTGAHVAVVHHGTKEGGSSRGSGALVGAADLIVKVTRGPEGEPAIAKVEGCKDDVDGAEMLFRLRLVEMPPDGDGDRRTTCVAEEAENGAKRRKPITGVNRHALSTLAELILSEGEALPPAALMPPNTKGVREDRWRAECDIRRLSMADGQKDRDRAFRRAAQYLRDSGEVAARDGWVWLLRMIDGQSGV